MVWILSKEYLGKENIFNDVSFEYIPDFFVGENYACVILPPGGLRIWPQYSIRLGCCWNFVGTWEIIRKKANRKSKFFSTVPLSRGNKFV
jgi:hypothetical protein